MGWQIIFGLTFLAVLIAVVITVSGRRRKRINDFKENDGSLKRVLEVRVHFYKQLTPAEQFSFLGRVKDFLSSIAITPVNGANVTTDDKILVAAAAIMPIFNFEHWRYIRLNEILIYPDAFTKNYDQEASDRNVGGMVGSGAMNRMMILSLPQLRAGFMPNASGNTALHEFVHLIDMSDGATDGIPEELLNNESIAPWMKLMQRNIREIHEGKSDIRAYGGTNPQEFFAVASEYFFQKPTQLNKNHPELYKLLQEAYGDSQDE